MRDPAGGRVQCELGGRGRKLEMHGYIIDKTIRRPKQSIVKGKLTQLDIECFKSRRPRSLRGRRILK